METSYWIIWWLWVNKVNVTINRSYCICYYCCICKKLSRNSLSCILLLQLLKWCSVLLVFYSTFCHLYWYLIQAALRENESQCQLSCFQTGSQKFISFRWYYTRKCYLNLLWEDKINPHSRVSIYHFIYGKKIIPDFLMNWRQSYLMFHGSLSSCWWCEIVLLRVWNSVAVSTAIHFVPCS